MRVRAFALVLGLAASLIGPLANSARAGGNWLQFRDQLVVGAKVTATNRYFDRSDVADPPYFAYLLRGPVGYPVPLRMHRDARVLGQVRVRWPGPHTGWTGSMANNPKLLATFTVPEVRPGNYVVSICNRPCTDLIKGIAPTSVTVYGTALEARLSARIASLEHRLYVLDQETRRGRLRGQRGLRREIDDVSSRAADRIEELSTRLSALQTGLRHQDDPWAEIGIAAALGAGIGFFASRRRRGSVDWDRLLTESRADEPARIP
jgi:ElaB/YqjD/DUF883 family membrane-anchored ribosome-binding protein